MAENWDQKVHEALAMLSAAETVKQTGGAVEINSVKIYPCDTYGRIPADSPVDYQPEPGDDDATVAQDGYDQGAGYDEDGPIRIPRGTAKGPARHDLDPSLVSRLHDLQDDFGARGVLLACKKLWPDADIAAWDDERRGVVQNMPQRLAREALDTYLSPTPFGDAFVTVEKPRTTLYTAGCISGDDRPFEEKAEVFYKGGASLRDKGYGVVNPLDVDNTHCHHGPEQCQQHTMRRLKGKDQGAGHAWECYMRNDLIALLQCDGVALLPGWEQSPGARWEFDTATRVGLPAKPIEEWLDARPTIVGVDPATGVTITGYVEDKQIHILRAEEPMTVDTNGHDYCARCRTSEGSHAPGGSRYGCTFAGPGTEDKCSQCGHLIVWDGLQWNNPSPAEGGWSAVCKDSTRPDVAHEPVGSGEQR